MKALYEIKFPEGYSFLSILEGSPDIVFPQIMETLRIHTCNNKIMQSLWDKYRDIKFEILQVYVESVSKTFLQDRLSELIRKRKEEAHPVEKLVIYPKGYADSHRPEWHKWVYGGSDNPLYERKR